MARFLKIFAIVLVALVLLIVLALFALTQFIDPNSFKPEIEQAAHDQANLTLDIKGDLAWSFWPSLGISIGETEVRIGDSTDLFAGVDEVKASVAVWPLFSGRVQVGNVLVDGIKLHLVQTRDGGNWEQIGAADDEAAATDDGAADSTKDEADDSPLDLPVTIPQVTIRNGNITYDDHTSDTHINVSQFNLTAEDVNLQSSEAFPLHVSLRYQDPDNLIDLDVKAQTSLDLAANHYRLQPMTLTADIKGPTPKPVSVRLEQNVDADLDQGVVAITDMVLAAAGTETTGAVTVSGLNDDKLLLKGRVKVAEFNANKVLKALGETPIETADAKALSRVAVDMTLDGPVNSAMLDPLVITLDDSTIKGKAGLASLDSGKIVFDLAMDRIVLDGYLPPLDAEEVESASGSASGGEASVSKEATQALSSEPLLAASDIQSVKDLNLDGKFTLGSWQYDQIKGKDLLLTAKAANGKVAVNSKGGLMAGAFDVASTFDASGKQPAFGAKGSLSALPIGPLVELATDRQLLTGVLRTNFTANAAGNSEKQLMESAVANFDFGLADAVLKGANLNDALADGVSDLLGKYKELLALVPEAKKLPRGLSKDTNLTTLNAVGSLKNQIVNLSSLKADVKEGDISGNGWLNINSNDFEFLLGMHSQKISDNPYLKDTTWPIRCAGNLDGDPKRWCGPDKSGMDKIAKQALATAAKQKLSEKLGFDVQGDSAGEAVQNAAKDAVSKEKEKAKDKLNEELGKGLKKLFR